MNKIKAPKDMDLDEFFAMLRDRVESGELKQPFTYNDLYGILCEPAPNPFTPDQLVVLRELQKSGFNYAAMDASEHVYIYRNKPEKDDGVDWWDVSNEGGTIYVESPFAFLTEVLSTGDKRPLRFSDYTLEGAADV